MKLRIFFLLLLWVVGASAQTYQWRSETESTAYTYDIYSDYSFSSYAEACADVAARKSTTLTPASTGTANWWACKTAGGSIRGYARGRTPVCPVGDTMQFSSVGGWRTGPADGDKTSVVTPKTVVKNHCSYDLSTFGSCVSNSADPYPQVIICTDTFKSTGITSDLNDSQQCTSAACAGDPPPPSSSSSSTTTSGSTTSGDGSTTSGSTTSGSTTSGSTSGSTTSSDGSTTSGSTTSGSTTSGSTSGSTTSGDGSTTSGTTSGTTTTTTTTTSSGGTSSGDGSTTSGTTSGTTTTTTTSGGTTTGGTSSSGDFCAQHPELNVCHNSTVDGGCGNITCNGDAIQCAIAREVAKRNCDASSGDDAIKNSKEYGLGRQVLDGNDPMASSLPSASNPTPVSVGSSLDSSGWLGGGGCFADKTFTVQGRQFTLPFSQACDYLVAFRYALMVVASLMAFRMLSSTILRE